MGSRSTWKVAASSPVGCAKLRLVGGVAWEIKFSFSPSSLLLPVVSRFPLRLSLRASGLLCQDANPSHLGRIRFLSVPRSFPCGGGFTRRSVDRAGSGGGD